MSCFEQRLVGMNYYIILGIPMDADEETIRHVQPDDIGRLCFKFWIIRRDIPFNPVRLESSTSTLASDSFLLPARVF